MKRLMPVIAMTLMLVSTEAAAETKSAIVYIPVDDVALSPSGSGPCADVSLSSWNAGLGCVPGLDGAQVVSAHPDALNLASAVATALAGFDVHVTTIRPPAHVPYYVLLPQEQANPESQSYTCTSVSLVCAGRGRDLIGFANTGTLNCTAPDTLQTMLYALGRMAGLEGSTDPAGAMHYPPDFVAPAAGYVDGCVTLSQQFGGEDGMTMLPLECTSVDHAPGGCGAGQQDPQAELLDVFGPATADVQAPVITIISPDDGAILREGSTLEIEMSVADANPHVAVLIDIASPALDEIAVGIPALQDGTLSACTSSWCDLYYLEDAPFRENDGPWEFVLPGLPNGTYTITFAATDYDGNEAGDIVYTIQIGGDEEPGTTSGSSSSSSGGAESDTGDTSTGGADSTSGTSNTGMTSTSTSTSTSTTAVDTTNGTVTTTGDEETATGTETDTQTDGAAVLDRGCSCRSPGPRSPIEFGAALLLLLGVRRRRARR